MEQIIIDMISSYPAVAQVIFVIGALRIVFKPLQGIIENLVAYTDSKKDDELWAKIKENKLYKWLAWLIDYTASIKIPGRS